MNTGRTTDALRRSPVRRLPALAALVAIVVTGAACSDDDGTDVTLGGGVQVRLTDAPSDYVAEARVWISRVYLQQDDDSDGEGEADGGSEAGDDSEENGRFDLFFDPENPREFDLMQLRDGVEADLAEAEVIPAGSWGQLRLVVDRAEVTLADGFVFEDDEVTAALTIPSGAQSGIKVQLTEPVDPDGDETVIILVDFDVDENFRITGPPPEANDGRVRGMLFTPVLKETRRQEVEND